MAKFPYAPADRKLYLLILKNSPTPLGLLASRVIDKTDADFKIEAGHIKSDFVLGAGTFQEKVLIFLKPNAIAAAHADKLRMAACQNR